MEIRLPCKDGSVKDVEAVGGWIVDDAGNYVGIQGSVRDITERKRAESERKQALDALRESEERYRAFFNACPDNISITRLSDGLWVDTNKGVTDFIGYRRDEVLGKTALHLNVWHDLRDRDRLVRGLDEQGYVHNMEAVFRTRDGSLKTGLISSGRFPIKSEAHNQVEARGRAGGQRG